jgi:mRNA interferase MazF
VKRGEVVLCVIAGDYGKPRPAVVIQSDLYNPTHASVAVLPITSHLVDAPLFRIDLKPGKQNGLKKDSQVMVDKVTAIRRDRIRESVGRLSPEMIGKIEESLRHLFALTHGKTEC